MSIDLPDEDLDEADAYVRTMFARSLARPMLPSACCGDARRSLRRL
jgi:hypothetical protein